MDNVSIFLTPNEVHTLGVYILNPQELQPSRDLLFNFGHALVNCMDDDGLLDADAEDFELVADEADIAFILDAVQFLHAEGPHQTGHSIYRKCFAALLRLHPEFAVEVEEVFEEELEEPINYQKARRKMRTWLKKQV